MKNLVTLILLYSIMISCNNPDQKKMGITKKGSAEHVTLIPYNEDEDINPHYKRNIKDTLTPDGWKIEYLVKNDSTKHKDLYIRWSKDNNKRTYCGHILLELQSYFTPVFKTETNDYIFMKFEVRGGDGILIFPKNNITPELSFSYVVGYSPEHAQVAYIPKNSYSTTYLDVEAYDLKSKKTKSVRFSRPCSVSPENSCITKTVFDGKQIKIYSNVNGSTDITETQTIQF